MAGSWLTGTTGSQTPCGLLTIAQQIALAALKMCSHTFLLNRYWMWQMDALNQTFLPHQRHARKPCYTKECEVTPNWTKHTKSVCNLDNKIFLCLYCCLICCCCCIIHTHKKIVPLIDQSCDRNHLRPTWLMSQIFVLEIYDPRGLELHSSALQSYQTIKEN